MKILIVTDCYIYNIGGIKKRHFVLPKWVAMLNYTSVVSIIIVMIFVLVFMSWMSPHDAFGNSSLIMHVICPVLILILFFQIENDQPRVRPFSSVTEFEGNVYLCTR